MIASIWERYVQIWHRLTELHLQDLLQVEGANGVHARLGVDVLDYWDCREGADTTVNSKHLLVALFTEPLGRSLNTHHAVQVGGGLAASVWRGTVAAGVLGKDLAADYRLDIWEFYRQLHLLRRSNDLSKLWRLIIFHVGQITFISLLEKLRLLRAEIGKVGKLLTDSQVALWHLHPGENP